MWSLSQKCCLFVAVTAVWTDHAFAQYMVHPYNACGSCQQSAPYTGMMRSPFVQQQIPARVNGQHLGYAATPYQTTPRFPSVSTPLGPNQTVRQLPQTHQVAPSGPAFSASAAAAPLTSADPFAPSTQVALPTGPSVAVSPQVSTMPGPIPDPRFLDTPSLDTYGSWSTIPQQQSALDGLAAGGSTGNETSQGPVKLLRPTAPDRFVRAPTAAIVWQTPRAIRRP